MVVTPEEKKQIAEKGYAYYGGIPRTRYWTPDGREIQAIPSWRTYRLMKDGEYAGDGTRDANLDKGWLPYKPENPKPHCDYCSKWHDTQEEVEACGDRKKADTAMWEEKARQMKKEEGGDIKERVDAIEGDISDIKSMLTQLLKEK